MGTLLAFAAVAVSVLVIRYIPPNEHLLSSVSESSSIGGHSRNMLGVLSELREDPFSGDGCQGSIPKGGQSHGASVDNEAYLSNLNFSGFVIMFKPILLFNFLVLNLCTISNFFILFNQGDFSDILSMKNDTLYDMLVHYL